MSDANPLEPPTPEQEERLRERAYFLWQEDGCPEGRADEYWERARELEAFVSNPDAGLLPNPSSGPDDTPGLDQPVEEAQIQENLGEFPDRLSDQGEHRPTPMTRREEYAEIETERGDS